MGQGLMKKMVMDHGIETWALEALRKIFIEGLLKNTGAEPDVVMMNMGKSPIVGATVPSLRLQ